MNDEQIIALYFKRDESAITETKVKYSAYCAKIAMNILNNVQDSEECINDTWFKTWCSIPPNHPSNLSAYLGKLTRNIALNRYNLKHAEKRAANEFAISLDELSECVTSGTEPDNFVQAELVGSYINKFLHTQKPLDRRVFVCRYFYCDTISDISARFGISESRVKSLLHRQRAKLKDYLISNDLII